jgi:hypothetical protein
MEIVIALVLGLIGGVLGALLVPARKHGSDASMAASMFLVVALLIAAGALGWL